MTKELTKQQIERKEKEKSILNNQLKNRKKIAKLTVLG